MYSSTAPTRRRPAPTPSDAMARVAVSASVFTWLGVLFALFWG